MLLTYLFGVWLRYRRKISSLEIWKYPQERLRLNFKLVEEILPSNHTVLQGCAQCSNLADSDAIKSMAFK